MPQVWDGIQRGVEPISLSLLSFISAFTLSPSLHSPKSPPPPAPPIGFGKGPCGWEELEQQRQWVGTPGDRGRGSTVG